MPGRISWVTESTKSESSEAMTASPVSPLVAPNAAPSAGCAGHESNQRAGCCADAPSPERSLFAFEHRQISPIIFLDEDAGFGLEVGHAFVFERFHRRRGVIRRIGGVERCNDDLIRYGHSPDGLATISDGHVLRARARVTTGRCNWTASWQNGRSPRRRPRPSKRGTTGRQPACLNEWPLRALNRRTAPTHRARSEVVSQLKNFRTFSRLGCDAVGTLGDLVLGDCERSLGKRLRTGADFAEPSSRGRRN